MERDAYTGTLRPGNGRRKEKAMKKWFAYGGVAASIILMAVGTGAIVIGATGYNEVQNKLSQEKIVGSPDMTPSAIKQEAKEAGLPSTIDLPTNSVAGQTIDTGAEAKTFASYMRIHALEATGGKTYAEMGRFLTPDGKETNDSAEAAKDPKTGAPVANWARELWVTETALATALNTSFFAERVAVFSIVMGVALLLTGIGFLVLTIGGALGVMPVPRRHPQTATSAVAS
jgi:hypothetical protein